jgi:hypothetical protein
MATAYCPHCLKKIPILKRLKKSCPFCFKPFRRRSGAQDRSLIGQWLEDRTSIFWFLLFLLMTLLAAMIMQLSGYPDLLRFIDSRSFWYVVTLIYASIFASIVGRIYYPLLWGAPKILRRERIAIRQYRILTSVGLIIGVPFAMLFTGVRDVWSRFPATVYLITVPVAILWAYHALTLSEEEYEDERFWTFMQEMGAQDRLEHRHNAYFVLVGLPIAALIFYYFSTHHWLYRMLKESTESGIISMFRELYHRTRLH